MDGIETSIAFLVILASFACSAYTAYMAEKKGYMGAAQVAWFLAGLFLPVIGIISVHLAPVKESGLVKTGAMKECPYCKEPVKIGAVLCKHCRSQLD